MKIDRYHDIPPLSFSLFFLAALSPLLFIVVLWITEPIVSPWLEARAERAKLLAQMETERAQEDRRSRAQSSQSTGLSEYQKCRLEYIGRRNLKVDRMSDHQKYEMEAALSADYPYGCGGLSK